MLAELDRVAVANVVTALAGVPEDWRIVVESTISSKLVLMRLIESSLCGGVIFTQRP
jgi:hypothetical protein